MCLIYLLTVIIWHTYDIYLFKTDLHKIILTWSHPVPPGIFFSILFYFLKCKSWLYFYLTFISWTLSPVFEKHCLKHILIPWPTFWSLAHPLGKSLSASKSQLKYHLLLEPSCGQMEWLFLPYGLPLYSHNMTIIALCSVTMFSTLCSTNYNVCTTTSFSRKHPIPDIQYVFMKCIILVLNEWICQFESKPKY